LAFSYASSLGATALDNILVRKASRARGNGTLRWIDINPLRTEFHLNNIYKFSLYLTGNISLLRYKHQPMLFREMVAVYCEDQMKHTNTVFWENPELRYVKACGTYNNHWALKG
jgi:hypothetical protein